MTKEEKDELAAQYHATVAAQMIANNKKDIE